ncbi:MAG: phosphogluconate dehydrogenase (NAD(+)-dependent, decarboxylating) [Actinomycetota bacterium]
MRFGIVGLGRMGANLARHAMEKSHQVVGYDPAEQARKELAGEGMEPAASLEELAGKLEPPRVVLLYVPHGDITEQVCRDIRPVLTEGDIVMDGGNSHWKDSERRYGFFAETGIKFLDCGTSGGVDGARTGACFMAGGPREAYEVVEPLLKDLAIDELGVVHASEAPGSGHFVKLVHNAIEFGMNQSIAEGVEMLMRSGYPIDLPAVFVNWNHGSVIRSWLVELMGQQLQKYLAEWDQLSTYVEDTEEVKWVLNWAMDEDIPSPVIALSQQALLQFRDLDWPAAKAHALLRNAYGGHPILKVGDTKPRA